MLRQNTETIYNRAETLDAEMLDDRRKWVVPEKIHTPPQRKFLPSGGGGETKLFLIIVNVLGHPKGVPVGGLTSNFLRGGGMDVFWNDPIDDKLCQDGREQYCTCDLIIHDDLF
jgi:hypothetical protein